MFVLNHFASNIEVSTLKTDKKMSPKLTLDLDEPDQVVVVPEQSLLADQCPEFDPTIIRNKQAMMMFQNYIVTNLFLFQTLHI